MGLKLLHLELCAHTHARTCTQGTRDTSYKDRFPRVQWLRAVHYKVTVIKIPGPDLDLHKSTFKKHLFPLSQALLLSVQDAFGISKMKGACCLCNKDQHISLVQFQYYCRVLMVVTKAFRGRPWSDILYMNQLVRSQLIHLYMFLCCGAE